MSEEQMVLPFGYRFAEDRASLLIAIEAAGLRRLDRAFVLMVHDVTRDGWLHKSYQELAERLHVSHSTARRCVRRCIDAGLVVAEVEQYRTGGQRENAYAIDWHGVRSYCLTAHAPEGPAVQGEQPPGQFDHPPVHPEQPPGQTDHPYRNILPPSDPPITPPPPQKARGGGGSEDSWAEVRKRLDAHGMADTVGAIQTAQSSGLTPAEVESLIDHWEQSRPAWDVGGLYWRLTRGKWPEQSAEYIRQQRRDSDQRQRRQQRLTQQQLAREAEAEEAWLRELEEQLGPVLDGLSPEELEQLVDRVYPDAWSRAYFNRQRGSPLVRNDLLMELEKGEALEVAACEHDG